MKVYDRLSCAHLAEENQAQLGCRQRVSVGEKKRVAPRSGAARVQHDGREPQLHDRQHETRSFKQRAHSHNEHTTPPFLSPSSVWRNGDTVRLKRVKKTGLRAGQVPFSSSANLPITVWEVRKRTSSLRQASD